MTELLLKMFGIEITDHAVYTVQQFMRALSIRESDITNGAPLCVQRLNDAALVEHSDAVESLKVVRIAA